MASDGSNLFAFVAVMNNGIAGSRPVERNTGWIFCSCVLEKLTVRWMSLWMQFTCDSWQFVALQMICYKVGDMRSQWETDQMYILTARISYAIDQLGYAFASVSCIVSCTGIARRWCQNAPINEEQIILSSLQVFCSDSNLFSNWLLNTVLHRKYTYHLSYQSMALKTYLSYNREW